MTKPLFRTALFMALMLSACISVPREHHTVSHRGEISAMQEARNCETAQFKNVIETGPAEKKELDSSGFQMLTWNVLKGMKDGWKEDFVHLSSYRDILTIQEAHLTDDLQELLVKGHYNWDLSTAFKYMGAETGVLTASKLEPDFTCTFRIKEPLTSLPKTVLITLYPLSNTGETLMVVNIHSINFTLGIEKFYTQLQKVEKILVKHNGPMIFSGDVNTWSNKRMTLLEDLAHRLGLEAVPFNINERTRIFGHAIDHVYYRQLTVTDAAVVNVTSSDHHPLLVSFRLKESG